MSDDTKKPEGIPPDAIDMSVRRVTCALHGEPYRAQWPLGYPLTMVMLFSHVLGKDSTEASVNAVWRDARTALGLAEDAEIPNKAGIEVALDRKPLCCRVTRAIMRRTYEESGVGVRARCTACRKKRVLGTAYQTMQGLIEHLCFDCVLDQVERHAKMH